MSDTLAVVMTFASLAFGVNITALSWIMKTLFELRREISGSHATFHANIEANRSTLNNFEGRISALERRNK
jgi:hypothetical protein